MDFLLQLGRELMQREHDAAPVAYKRLCEAAAGEISAGDISDRDLIAAAQEAVRGNQPATALVALEELALRAAADEPIEALERLAA